MCTAAAEVLSARKGGHNRTSALQTLVQETGTSVWCVALTCQFWGLPYPGGSSWDLTCTLEAWKASPHHRTNSRAGENALFQAHVSRELG